MTDFIEIKSKNKNNDLIYFPKDDRIIFCKNKREVTLSDRSWISGSLLSIDNSQAYYIDGIAWPISSILPYKLKYLNFKNYKIENHKLFIKKFKLKKTKKSTLISKEKYNGRVLEFHDNAEYSYFTLLMNDLINLKNKTSFSTVEFIKRKPSISTELSPILSFENNSYENLKFATPMAPT
jgi:hypothetical protein